jgi:cytochrome c-type biogenesis protein
VGPVSDISPLAAFVAGFLSFVSPAVVGFLPGFLACMAALTIAELRQLNPERDQPSSFTIGAIVSSLLFVLGFALVFVWLVTLGVVRLGWPERFVAGPIVAKAAVAAGAFVLGLAFGFGWEPSVGPILAGIFAKAAQDPAGGARSLLATYAAGLSTPLLLSSIALNQFLASVVRHRRYHHAIEIAAGVLIAIVGVLIVMNRFSMPARLLISYLPTF